MNDTVPITEQLQAAIECQLAQPPARAGMRLKTMRDLARMAGVSHDTVYRSLGRLVERGILARKRGSGVYVRKVPSIAATQIVGAGASTLKLKNIFADDLAPTRLRPEPKHARLQLDLWWGVGPLGVSARLIQRGMVDQARELGHQLAVHALAVAPHAGAKQEFPSKGCDGHIVLVPVAQTFRRTVVTSQQPMVYVWCGNADPIYQPLVQIDMDEAFRRALQLLASEGHERIGVLGWTNLKPRQWALYEQTLGELGLRYRAAEFSDATEKNDAAAIRRLLTRRDAPQALYVADDMMMRNILPVLRTLGHEPGRDLALISFANRGNPLPAGIEWSRMEFDPYAVGRLAVQSLVREIESAGDDLLSFTHNAAWRTGSTHRVKK